MESDLVRTLGRLQTSRNERFGRTLVASRDAQSGKASPRVALEHLPECFYHPFSDLLKASAFLEY
jgi:hypothetical protein